MSKPMQCENCKSVKQLVQDDLCPTCFCKGTTGHDYEEIESIPFGDKINVSVKCNICGHENTKVYKFAGYQDEI